MAMLEAKEIRKQFGKQEILKGVSLSIEKGEVVSIIGPSGSGKSTFLRCVNCLETIDGGALLIDGQAAAKEEAGGVVYAPPAELRALRGRLSLVFQNFNLFPHLSVLQNLTLAPIDVLKKTREEAEATAVSLLKKVGLEKKAKSYPCELSGGQSQRVAIARALAMNPEILCFDEPTSALDPELTGEVLRVIRSLADENMTMLIVTHEMGFASELSDRVLFIDEGVVLDSGTPDEIFNNTKEPRIQAFLAKLLSV